MDLLRVIEVGMIALSTISGLLSWRGNISEKRLKERIDTANLQSEARLIEKLDKRFMSADLITSKLDGLDSRTRTNAQNISQLWSFVTKGGDWRSQQPERK